MSPNPSAGRRARVMPPRAVLLVSALTSALTACNCGGGDPQPGPSVAAEADAGAADSGETAPSRPAFALTITGTVVDVDEQPVAAAGVKLGERNTTTDSGGRFVLAANPSDGRSLQVRAEGYAPAERALPSGEGQLSVPPIALLRVTASGDVDAAAGGSVGSLASGVVVTVPGGAFPRAVRVTTAVVPLGDPLVDELRLPAPMPSNGSAAASRVFGLVLEAEGLQPAHPLTVQLAAAVRLPQGTRVPVGRFDSAVGSWVDAGVATAGEDGTLTLSLDHLSTFAGALPALPKDPAARAPDLDALERVPSPFLGGEPRVEPRSGALQVGLQLPALLRRNAPYALTLFHDSRTVQGELSLPVAVPDARPGEKLILKAYSGIGARRVRAIVADDVGALQPAVVALKLREQDAAVGMDAPSALRTAGARVEGRGEQALVGPGATSAAEPALAPTEPNPPQPELSTGAHPISIVAERAVEGRLHAAADDSFVALRRGPPLESAPGVPVEAPAPVALANTTTRVVSVDNRGKSPFGPGWHLQGLTRLVQPWCSSDEVTLAGGFELPAITFGSRSAALVLSRLTAALPQVEPARLAGAKIALSGDSAYVATHVLDGSNGYLPAVFRVPLDGGEATLFAGRRPPLDTRSCSGRAADLAFYEVVGIAGHPSGDGIYLAVPECVMHVSAAGDAVPVVGDYPMGLDEPLPAEGVKASEVEFREELVQMFTGPSDGLFVVNAWGAEPFIVRDGVLHALPLMSEPGGHELAGALDAQGGFVYQTAFCIRRWVDGINDPPLFATCAQGLPTAAVDGPAEQATVGVVSAMAFDAAGNLYLVDQTFNRLRRLGIDGVLTTLAGPDGADGQPLPALFGLAVGSSRDLALTATAELFRLHAPAGDALQALGDPDGSLLERLADSRWQRRLPDGTRERYDARGLLEERWRPGEPGLTYRYRPWAAPAEAEHCGAPAAPPLLESVELGGATLFQLEWDGDRLAAVTDVAGRRSTVAWSAGRPQAITAHGGEPVQFGYDDDGRVTEKSSRGPAGTIVRFRYGYAEGRLVSAEIPGRGTRTWQSAEGAAAAPLASFSAAGVARDLVAGPARSTLPGARGGEAKLSLAPDAMRVADAAGNLTVLEMDERGRVLRSRDPDGTVLKLTRDLQGRVVEVLSEATGERWTYEYHRQSGLLARRTDPAGRSTSFEYDEEGRLRLRRDPGGGSLLIEAELSSGLARGLPRRMTDAIGRVTQVEYDAQGNPVKFIDPDGRETLVERDRVGRPVRVTDAFGVDHSSQFDDRGELTAQTLGDPGAGRTVSYQRVVADGWQQVGSHVPASALMSALDAEGRTWSFARDLAFQPQRLDGPGEGEVLQRFDELGRRVERQTADGSIEHFAWDAAGRLESRNFSGPAAGASLSLRYDELGRVQELISACGSERRIYAPGLGWIANSFNPGSALPEAARFTVSRSRASWSVATQQMGATTYSFHRDFDGKTSRLQLERTAAPGRRDVFVAAFDAARRPTAIERGNGTRTVLTYDAAGRVQRQDEITRTGTITFTYAYDAAGRPASRTVGGLTRTYGYDEVNRLASCSDTAETFTYDRNGARAGSGAQPWQRDARGRLTSDGVNDYSWDDLGRRLTRTARSGGERTEYVWGAGGALVEVRVGAAGATTPVASYVYDGSGRRVMRSAGGRVWLYGYLPDSDRMVRMVEPSGTTWHLAHATSSAAYTVAATDDGAERYVHLDPFERVLGVSDEGGTLWLLEEDCYGRRLATPNLSGPLPGLHGMTYDDETGLYFAGPRQLDAAVGEFLSPDPLGLEAGSAPWGYGGANPVLSADPSGRFFFVAAGAFLVGAAILEGVREFKNSDEVKRAEQSYRDLDDCDALLNDDDKLESASRAHQNLHRASDKGGDTAIEGVKQFVDAATNPITGAKDLAEAVGDKVTDYAKDKLEEATGVDLPEPPSLNDFTSEYQF